jgi:hypothetical protein
MASKTYALFREAMEARRPLRCVYRGRRRDVCAILLGHTDGREKSLTFQFAGESNSGLPKDGEWRCLWLDDVGDVELIDGPWRAGSSHTQPQGCVHDVDFDVNPRSPYTSRKLGRR